MAFYKVPGVSVAVFENGKLAWAKGYGVRDAEGTAPVDAETLFQAGSISKPVTAVAVMRLVERGLLSLDEPVNDKLTSWKIPDNALTAGHPVTLRELLSHSAGLTVHGFPGYARGAPVPSLVEVLDGRPPANTPAIVVNLTPGTQWRYSGGGYTVIQQLLDDVTGKPFPETLKRLVLDPAGMTHSRFEQPLSEAARGRRAGARGARLNPDGRL
jgi:CubicO group peptidase (beta-lactamase class C family)